jgi:hypothetical protein
VRSLLWLAVAAFTWRRKRCQKLSHTFSCKIPNPEGQLSLMTSSNPVIYSRSHHFGG